MQWRAKNKDGSPWGSSAIPTKYTVKGGTSCARLRGDGSLVGAMVVLAVSSSMLYELLRQPLFSSEDVLEPLREPSGARNGARRIRGGAVVMPTTEYSLKWWW